MTATLRHQPGSNRAPARGKPARRGASRLVAKEPISLRISLPKARLTGMGSWLKRLTWPLLLLALGYGTYELSLRALPYADQPIARISVEGDLSYVNQQAVQERIAPYANASFFSVPVQPASRAGADAVDCQRSGPPHMAGSVGGASEQ